MVIRRKKGEEEEGRKEGSTVAEHLYFLILFFPSRRDEAFFITSGCWLQRRCGGTMAYCGHCGRTRCTG